MDQHFLWAGRRRRHVDTKKVIIWASSVFDLLAREKKEDFGLAELGCQGEYLGEFVSGGVGDGEWDRGWFFLGSQITEERLS